LPSQFVTSTLLISSKISTIWLVASAETASRYARYPRMCLRCFLVLIGQLTWWRSFSLIHWSMSGQMCSSAPGFDLDAEHIFPASTFTVKVAATKNSIKPIQCGVHEIFLRHILRYSWHWNPLFVRDGEFWLLWSLCLELVNNWKKLGFSRKGAIPTVLGVGWRPVRCWYVQTGCASVRSN